MNLTIEQLAERLGAELVGKGDALISAVGTIEAGSENMVTFAKNKRHVAVLSSSRAGAVIVSQRIEGVLKPQLVVKNIEAALIEALKIFAPKLKAPVEGVDPTAKVGRDVKIGKSVSVGPLVVIDDGVEIGQGSVLCSGCKIGENCRVGKNCRLGNNVVVCHNCIIGDNVIIQANSVIGSTGFGYSFIEGGHRLIPHNGNVVIEDFVEIGSCCCVDRAKFGSTIIGAGTKIDNLVQIAHNVVMGKCCLLAGHVGIAGSCKIGDGVVFAGASGATDNIEIGDGVMIGAQSAVLHSVAAGRQVWGTPAIDKKEAIRIYGMTKRLPKFVEKLKQLRARIEKLESSKDDKD
jgi:UDP-3-O-[3-hydroxymyristoyl] glucosamine N-acyltransferase